MSIPLTGWIKTDAKNQVECPLCNAKPGEKCRFPSGREKLDGPHGVRIKAYRETMTREEFDRRHSIPFEDNKGNVTRIPGDVTIVDLVKSGVRHIRLADPSDPLEDGWIRSKDKEKP